MFNKNEIIELDSNKKYIVVGKLTDNNEEYYYLNMITNNERETTSVFRIITIKQENGNYFVKSIPKEIEKNIEEKFKKIVFGE